MLQSSSNDSNLAETCIHCIETWIEFDGANLSDWQQIIVLCLSKIQSSPDLISIVSKFFQNFVENSELYRMESFVAQLYDYASKTKIIPDILLNQLIIFLFFKAI